MKNRKRHDRYDPVFIGSCLIYDDDEHGCNQESQQQAPAFPYMDQHFIQIILNKKPAYHKWNDQQADRNNNPYGSRDGRKCKTDMRQQISPIELMGKI